MTSLPIIILYESRVLLREGLTAQLQEAGHQVVACLSMEQLTKEICQQTEHPKILLVGAGGRLVANVILKRSTPLHSIFAHD